MNTTNWRSTIWQKLFSIHRNDEQLHREKPRIGDEEEAHELLLSSHAHAKETDGNSDFPPPYADEEDNNDDDDDDDDESEAIESNQPQLKRSRTAREAGQSKHEKGCASRRASLLAATVLTVVLLVGLLVMSIAGITHNASNPEGTTHSYPEPNPSSPVSGTTAEDGHTALPTPAPQSPPSPPSTTPPSNTNAKKPHHPILRHSWTSLTPLQQHSYIAALQCLRTLPPLLPHMPTNASAYSDYPYVHAHIGYRTHNAASFLPWHRYFLSLYEQRLRMSCGYDGGIPYWDWSADADAHPSADLSLSAVFDAVSGFGGNGGAPAATAADGSATVTAGRHGHCVATGPFAGLQVLWYDVQWRPHCLSRGFRTDEAATGGGAEGSAVVGIDGAALTSAEIDRVLELDGYEAFVGALEKRVHDVVPFGVGGDFETFSAPFEPLFWLHHAQLDRLWSLWQRRQTLKLEEKRENDDNGGGDGDGDEGERGREGGERVFEYAGHRFRHSIEKATLDDLVEMGGVLGGDVKVRELMDVEGGCAGVDTDGEDGSGILCVGYV